MKRWLLIGTGTALALGSATLALAAPEDLLPPSFANPPPRPAPTATATRAPVPAATATARPAPGATSAPVVQALPGAGTDPAAAAPVAGSSTLPEGFPTLAELEAMEEDEIDALLGLRPKFDIPPAARRAMEEVGVISYAEGGFARNALARQPAALVRAALNGTRGPVVSRWGHILLRRALASRLNAPAGMDPAEFATLRARALNAMGEGTVARALVQDVDAGNYTPPLSAAALDAYVATGDILGMCPVLKLQAERPETGEWELLAAICTSFEGESRNADRRLQRALGTGLAEEIDVRLAQRFAGAAGEAGRAVNIEWDGVAEMTPWRFALARALGVEVPGTLVADGRYDLNAVQIPATPLPLRAAAAERAGARGVLSAQAMVDLHSLVFAAEQLPAEQRADAVQLRAAYAAGEPAARLAAMRELWGDGSSYGKLVLTAYAAARLPVDGNAAPEDAARLITAMLAAGLDRNALRWGNAVAEGSQGWALLALAQPARRNPVEAGAVSSFAGDDASEDQRKSQFLLAGLAGLGRLAADDVAGLSEDLGVDLSRRSAWSDKIDAAAAANNPALVALLAGLGMQGTGWERMTARHLFHIVRALDRVGLGAEARMIAAEAVARG